MMRMTMRKRALAFALALTMMLALMPAVTLAASSGVCGEHLTWELDAAGELYIEGYGAMYDYTEEEKAPWNDSAASITSVLLPEGLTHLGDRALLALTGITELELPATLETIGAFAINSCSALTELELPEGLTSIGDYALSSCAGLLRIEVPQGCELGKGAFSGDIKLAEAVLPDDLKVIPDSLFMGCTKLTDTAIPESVTDIGKSAFSGCIVLAEIDIGENVERIGEGAFSGCIALTDIILPDSVKTMEKSAFSGCSGLKSVRLSHQLSELAESVFSGCSALTEVEVPEGVTAIGAYAFSTCSLLEKVTLPETLESIGDYAFFNCTSIKTLIIPRSVTSIGENAFTVLDFLSVRPLDVTLYIYTDYVEDYCIANDLNYIRLTAELVRLAGRNRTQTAVAISQAGFESAETVVLASGNDFPDALAGGPLAYALRAPILLVRGKLDDATREELERLNASRIVILGGELAVSGAVEEELAEKYAVERVAGQNRYETAVKIAEKLAEVTGRETEEVFFASAENYPDALAISPVAALKGYPILYVAANGRLNATGAYVEAADIGKGTILGGEVAVAKAAETALEAFGVETERLFGTSRYDTNMVINQQYAALLDGEGICAATGRDYPDALTGGVYAAMRREPLLLTAAKLQAGQADYIRTRAPRVITVFGGTAAISDALVNEMLAALR